MATIYEVFEFKQGKSLRHIEGPVTYIRVEDGEDKYEVLDNEGLPGNTYGYGLREITDIIEEVTVNSQRVSKATILFERLIEASS